MIRNSLLLIGFFFSLTALSGQASNIYMFDLNHPADTVFDFRNPRYLTSFNSEGYNNHPSFFDENVLYISSQKPGELQPEVYRLDLSNRTVAQVTQTQEGEYSPVRMPDYYNFSAVRMEFQGRDTLIRLWQFPIDRVTNGRPIFKYMPNIGYYCWLNSTQVACFLNGNIPKLAIGDVRTDQFSQIDQNVGRCFRLLPSGNLIYVKKTNFGLWQLVEYNPINQQSDIITSTLPQKEDFGILSDGTLIMGNGSKLYKFNRVTDTDWVEIADFRFYGIDNITRIAVSRTNKIAIVAN